MQLEGNYGVLDAVDGWKYLLLERHRHVQGRTFLISWGGGLWQPQDVLKIVYHSSINDEFFTPRWLDDLAFYSLYLCVYLFSYRVPAQKILVLP